MYSDGNTVELGVEGTVASAAGPSAALKGVAGTGVTYPDTELDRSAAWYSWDPLTAILTSLTAFCTGRITTLTESVS